MLEFGSMEERDAVIARITPLLVRNPQGSGGGNIEPSGPLAAEKKQLLEEDKCATATVRRRQWVVVVVGLGGGATKWTRNRNVWGLVEVKLGYSGTS